MHRLGRVAPLLSGSLGAASESADMEPERDTAHHPIANWWRQRFWRDSGVFPEIGRDGNAVWNMLQHASDFP